MILELPTGECILNATPDDIRTLLKQGDDYWYNAGDAVLSTDGIGNSETMLLIFRDKKYGYYILDLNSYQAPSGDEKDKSLLIVYDMGGDPFLVPLCCHLNYSQTESILLHFLQSGKRLNGEKWYDIYEGQEECFIDNELFCNCVFGEMLKIRNGKVTRL